MKLAVWGLGAHAINKILPALSSCQQIELYGLYSRNHDVVEQCCREYDIKCWHSEEAFLHDEQLDVVYVSTPIGLHAAQGKKLLESGKHFWCEKPMTTDIDSARELADTADERQLSAFEGMMYLHHPQFAELKSCLNSGKIGRIRTINCRFGIPFLANPGFRYNSKLGGSVCLDVGCYPVSVALELLEENPEIHDAEIRWLSGYGVDMEGHVRLHDSSGIDAYLEWAMGRSYRNEIDVWGEDGSIYVDRIFSKAEDYTTQLCVKDKSGNQKSIKISAANHFTLMFDSFALIVHSGPVAIAEENKRALRRMYYLDKIKNQAVN